MRYLKHIVFFIIIIQYICCIESKKETIKDKYTSVPVAKAVDTVLTTYRFKIVNDTAILNIQKINEDLKNHFILHLNYRGKNVLTKRLDKANIIEENQSRMFLDSINNDYTAKSNIKDIEFLFTRGSTLYFKCTLENNLEKKKIHGRFNLFYKSDRRGLVYGWITDEVNNLTL